jgi:hypothetical protein
MTRDVYVPDEVFAGVRKHSAERNVVEAPVTIAARQRQLQPEPA